MPDLKGTKTHKNLKDAFAAESQANRRYLYFAKIADIEGQPDIGGLFRDTAEGETGHAHGHLDYLKPAGDPVTDQPIGNSLNAGTQHLDPSGREGLRAQSTQAGMSRRVHKKHLLHHHCCDGTQLGKPHLSQLLRRERAIGGKVLQHANYFFVARHHPGV